MRHGRSIAGQIERSVETRDKSNRMRGLTTVHVVFDDDQPIIAFVSAAEAQKYDSVKGEKYVKSVPLY